MTTKPKQDETQETPAYVEATFTAEPREWVDVAPGVSILLERDHPTVVQVRTAS